MKKIQDNIKYGHLVAGLSGGVASTLVLHPFDLIKIRFQVNDGSVIKHRQAYTGVVNAFSTIIRNNGLKGLYQGVSPNVAGAGTSWGLYFFVFNFLKSSLREHQKVENLSPGYHLLVGAASAATEKGMSKHQLLYQHCNVFTPKLYQKGHRYFLHQLGAFTLTCTNPLWVIKTRMCLQPGVPLTQNEYHYKGVLDGLVKLYKQEGIRGYYRGYFPGLLGVSHGALQFMAYEELKKEHSRITGQPTGSKLGPFDYIVMAALSKVFAVVTTYPYQVVRSRMQDKQLETKYTGVIDVFQKIYRLEGLAGFYKGLVPSLLRVTPACCITFLVYENISHYLIPDKR